MSVSVHETGQVSSQERTTGWKGRLCSSIFELRNMVRWKIQDTEDVPLVL